MSFREEQRTVDVAVDLLERTAVIGRQIGRNKRRGRSSQLFC